ncbi:DUF6079 family protein [Rhodopseudomonas palustris]|uniref:ATP-binding protein n=1 Tax=Rhodopseudomonas palustris TaxID=1076 RepID=A0A418VJF8_RHOPL|nr:DUF6079 family protein [Rhodopseudomonas palustris]RJF76300.1 ATP-binding protein [Rhodopseudomonas palustris]
MKYSDLIQFEPIETVVQLREADTAADARRLVETFVISDRMADMLGTLVFPQLQFNKPADNKGLLVVGNYGTGKSHLMAVISAIAEHADLISCIANPTVAKKAADIAGRFRVIRAEIGSTTMSLRDIVCSVLEDGLGRLGVTYEFPSTEDRHENKSAFEQMMAAFQAKHPDRGLVLVLDELLDYLRSRADQALSLDLSFLRELGEVCKGSRFRFTAGVQESLFDNPRFQFVADTLRRVKDRFEQVRIARDDVAFVVAERILKKDAKQQALIREHLKQFSPLYGSMNERMEEFVRLFPIHPAYLDTFERVYVAEKREVLKTLSAAIRRIIDQEVPRDDTGLIAYDSYWSVLRDNPSFRSDPAIKEVIDRSGVLDARVQQAFTRPQYKPAAIRIVHALSVHRLTTSDIYAPIGATAEELRDDLCLMLPVPEKDAGFLRTLVETVLKELLRTVSGQFLSFNKENGQYFLDLKKDVDFDSLIEKRAETLSDAQLDRYYFDALRRVVLEDPDAAPYVTGYRIWEHEIEWRERHAGRSGYLFFGAPNERSTAQPVRDFYLYFLQRFDAPYFKDEKKPDEVFFKLKDSDDAFDRVLRLYAGAREQSAAASGSNKKIYEDKAGDHLRTLTSWLREHMPTAVEVVHQGRSKTLQEVVRGKLPPNATVKDYVNTAGSALLAPHFSDRSPEYPIFSVLVTRQNRDQAAQEALRWIAGGVKSKQGTAILDALELLDGETLKPRNSRYAKHVLDALSHKGQGQVLNRSELVGSEAGVDYWTKFRVEPEFLSVVLAALVHSGDIVLSLAGRKVDAAGIDQFAKVGIAEVTEFKHIDRPRDLPLGPLQDLCDLLDVPKGLIVNPANRDDGVAKIQQRAGELLGRVVAAQARIPELIFWSRPILSEQEQKDWKDRLGSLKAFLESLQPFNTSGKLKNFPYDSAAVLGQKPAIDLSREVDDLGTVLQQTSPLTSYLGKAEALLDASHPWQDAVRTARADLMAKIASPKQRSEAGFKRLLTQTLGDLKTKYQDAYLAAHERVRLGVNDDKRKANLAKDSRLAQIQKIANVEMMPTPQLRDFENRLFALKTCFQLGRPDLDSDPLCPHCGFRPAEEPAASATAKKALADLDEALDALLRGWTDTLRTNLEDPTVSGNIELVTDLIGKRELHGFLKSKALPDPVSPAFLKALQEVLGGLQPVKFGGADLLAALSEGGLPCTVSDLKERFDRYIANLTKGKDASKVRIIIE